MAKINEEYIDQHQNLSLEMLYVEGGDFKMGANKGPLDHYKPMHEVKVSDFHMGKHFMLETGLKNSPKKLPPGERENTVLFTINSPGIIRPNIFYEESKVASIIYFN